MRTCIAAVSVVSVIHAFVPIEHMTVTTHPNMSKYETIYYAFFSLTDAKIVVTTFHKSVQVENKIKEHGIPGRASKVDKFLQKF